MEPEFTPNGMGALPAASSDDVRRLPRQPRWRPESFVLPGPASSARVGMGDRTWAILDPMQPESVGWLAGLSGSDPLDRVIAAAPPALGGPSVAVAVLVAIDRLGLLEDAAATPPRPTGTDVGALRAEAARVAAGRGQATAAAVLGARFRASVVLHGDDAWAGRLAECLRGAGVGRTHVLSRPPHTSSATHDLVVLLGRSGLLRSSTRALDEPLIAGEQPYIGIEIGVERMRATPLLIPGVRGCLRCWWLHRSAADPIWAVLTGRVAGRSIPVLSSHQRHLALAHGTRLILDSLDESVLGTQGAGIVPPAPVSTTIDLGSGLVTRDPWTGNAACGCLGAAHAA